MALTNQDERDIDAALDEAIPKPVNGKDLGEAPFSANMKAWADGYGIMFTMRGNSMSDVMAKLEYTLEYAQNKGWKPSWNEETNKQMSLESKEDCAHKNTETKVSKSEKNPGKTFRRCKDCNKFLGWVD